MPNACDQQIFINQDNIDHIQNSLFKNLSKTRYGNSNCLHLNCSKCHGTGIDKQGKTCVHMIACSCPRCTVWC